MQHLAFKVDNHEELMAMRDRLRSKGVPVIGPMDHGFCCSIYFAGLENLALELSYSDEAINPEAWCDPEVVALCGISEEELANFKTSSPYEDESGAVIQASADGPGPHMTNYGKGSYKDRIAIPDEVIWANSENQPPVPQSSSGGS